MQPLSFPIRPNQRDAGVANGCGSNLMYISPKKIMAAQYKLEPDGSISITLNIKPQGSMLEQEEQIAEAVAEVGRLATVLSLNSFDTDGQPVIVSNVKHGFVA